MMTWHDLTDLKLAYEKQCGQLIGGKNSSPSVVSSIKYIPSVNDIRKHFGYPDVTIPDTEFNREELRKQRLPISTDITPVEKKDLMPALRECITCGSHSFKELGNKLKCEYCGNEY